MKKVKILAAFICAASINANAADNLFQPKKEGISEDELNMIVQNELHLQRESMTRDFENQIDGLRAEVQNSQQSQIDAIFQQIQALQEENQELKNNQRNTPVQRYADTNDGMINGGTDESEANETLGMIFEEPDSFILTDDIMRLNKEFGETSLTFVGIIDDHKMYKNSNGEYIIKGLDFEYDSSQQAIEETAMGIK